MITSVSKRMTFSAGHRIFNPEYSDDKNRQIFGDCSNPSGHGHNYILEVTLTGPVDPETGMIINLKEMKAILQNEIVNKVDHKNLNLDVPFMKDIIPTTENLAAAIWNILDDKFGAEMLTRLVLWESENNKVEITR